MTPPSRVASIVMAAGRGSRMSGYEGNKTLLPLLPRRSPYVGRVPMLHHILEKLPSGPKAIVVHYQKEAVMQATRGFNPIYIEQPRLNGTGGALLAARSFLESLRQEFVIVTMGDVPLVRSETYMDLLNGLASHDLVVLGFEPQDKRRYGVLQVEGPYVRRIIEWKDWSGFPAEAQAGLTTCNAGIYAARTPSLLKMLPLLASQPHRIRKTVDGREVELEEFFITDMIAYLNQGNRSVGYVCCENETETMGADDLEALTTIQAAYRSFGPNSLF